MGLDVYNITAYEPPTSSSYPLSYSAILFPLLGFPAWILSLPPMIWHYRQGNVAAGSLITWITLYNFFNSINALIWPRDNILEWWDGAVWCDINVRIQAGSAVGLAASTACVVRKLARIMDTSNITVSCSKKSKVTGLIWEVVWCWGFPLLLIIVYYVVQPVRYMIYGIVGCMFAYDTSWPSIVLSYMWGPITMVFVVYWASLLIYRLYRYRREFHRLLVARATTSSRFIRLFIISLFTIIIYSSYCFYLLVELSIAAKDPYDWAAVHDPTRFNTIMRIPMQGKVQFMSWVQIATGYVIFVLFGTGVDAHNLYKRMLVGIGLGRIWPGLYVESGSGTRTPNSSIAARTWTSNMSSRAKSMLWSSKTNETNDTYGVMTRNNSVVLEAIPHLKPVTTRESHTSPSTTTPQLPFLKRIFTRPSSRKPILPIFTYRNIDSPTTTSTDRSAIGVQGHAWAASKTPATGRVSEADGVHVIREIHQDHHERVDVGEKDFEKKTADAWV